MPLQADPPATPATLWVNHPFLCHFTYEPFSFQHHVVHTAFIHAGILFLSASILTPSALPMTAYTLAGFWIGVGIAFIRRRSLASPTDILFLKYGLLPCLLSAGIAAATLVPLRETLLNS